MKTHKPDIPAVQRVRRKADQIAAFNQADCNVKLAPLGLFAPLAKMFFRRLAGLSRSDAQRD
jgi:hypothetical protein